ncbi:RdgB/HAM1 family non-canonical purine NTP pyrophosphatase [bacterium]|nr:RdgB/HAM1 family non-canonical purine NTP pyrophosphatase [bacterium]
MHPPKLLVSTRNQHKLDEIHAIMSGTAVELLSLASFPSAPEVVEDADTLEGNASKKSDQLFAFTGLDTVADDTGLEVMALNGAPGVYSARFAGENSTDQQNRDLLLTKLHGIQDRQAQFRTIIAFTTGSGTFLFEGSCKGRIALAETGTYGFGYDSIFIPDGFNQSFAEMDASQKNQVSHRSRALKRFSSYLSSIIS